MALPWAAAGVALIRLRRLLSSVLSAEGRDASVTVGSGGLFNAVPTLTPCASRSAGGMDGKLTGGGGKKVLWLWDDLNPPAVLVRCGRPLMRLAGEESPSSMPLREGRSRGRCGVDEVIACP